MRILILDDRGKRARDLKRVLLLAVGDAIICVCGRPPELDADEQCNFDFVALHFSNGKADDGRNAYAFLEGVTGGDNDGALLKVQKGYFALGAKIRNSGQEPSILIYSGGDIEDCDEEKIRKYGQNVGLREWVGLSKIPSELSADLLRAVSDKGVELQALCPSGEAQSFLPATQSYLPALLILCEGWLITNLDPETGKPTIEGGEANTAYPELIRALQTMTGESGRKLPQFLSSILPEELRNRRRREEIREDVRGAGWWSVIAHDHLRQLIKQEARLEDLGDARLTELSALLALIENRKSVTDVWIVAKAYCIAHDLIGDAVAQK